MSMNLGMQFGLLLLAILVALAVECASFTRLKRWNWWLTLLTGTTVLYQLLVTVVVVLCKTSDNLPADTVLLLSGVGGLAGVLVATGMCTRRITGERRTCGLPLSCLRGASVALLLCAFVLSAQLAHHAMVYLGSLRGG